MPPSDCENVSVTLAVGGESNKGRDNCGEGRGGKRRRTYELHDLAWWLPLKLEQHP
jgi:hypothetical protein